MKRIVLSFSTTRWFSSAFLRWAQRCQFSHIEVIFNDGQEDEYAIGARVKGVDKYTDFSHLINRTNRYIEVDDEKFEKFSEFLHDKIGQKYDWRAYLGFLIFRNVQKENSWFCSELVQEAFEYANIKIMINSEAYWSTPRDFWISPVFSDPVLAKPYVPIEGITISPTVDTNTDNQ